MIQLFGMFFLEVHDADLIPMCLFPVVSHGTQVLNTVYAMYFVSVNRVYFCWCFCFNVGR